MRTNFLLAIALTAVAAPATWAQRGIEVTPFIGRQANGGLDLSTALYNRIEVQNGLNYGVSVGYLIGNYGSAEFTWNHNKADTVAQPVGGGINPKIFNLNTNQYLGDFLWHFKGRESRLRPFALFGGGATNFAPDRSNVNSITRFTWVFGGGAKYNFSQHLGLRFQAKWSPAWIATTTKEFWCDPFWAGCWAVGNSYFLHELDATGGITLRF